jgi:hypothetical protein
MTLKKRRGKPPTDPVGASAATLQGVLAVTLPIVHGLKGKGVTVHTMTISVLRYYYFLADDEEKIDQLCRELKRSEYKPDDGTMTWNLFSNEEGQLLKSMRHGNMLLLVLGVRRLQGSWASIMGSLDEVEKKAGLPNSDILGKVTVLGSDAGSWEQLLESAHGVCAYSEVIRFDIEQGQLGRLDWKWPHGHACYLFRQEGSSPALDSFFGSCLPMIEAALIGLNMVSDLYQDRIALVSKERQECDTRLSHILHTQLVSVQAPLKEVEELEEQVRDLSFSYGILAGDYSLISEAGNHIAGLVDAVIEQTRDQRFLKIKHVQMEAVLTPYRSRLAQLKKTEEDLRMSRENHQAAIDVVRSRIDIMMSRENIETQERIKDLLEINTSIQKQSLTFQIAAGIIEFIVLAYYSHSLWEAVTPTAYALVPPWLQLVGSVILSAIAVVFTHLLAEYQQGDKHVKGKLIFYATVLLVFLIAVIVATIILQGKAPH